MGVPQDNQHMVVPPRPATYLDGWDDTLAWVQGIAVMIAQDSPHAMVRAQMRNLELTLHHERLAIQAEREDARYVERELCPA